jgi:hypothetical protein
VVACKSSSTHPSFLVHFHDGMQTSANAPPLVLRLHSGMQIFVNPSPLLRFCGGMQIFVNALSSFVSTVTCRSLPTCPLPIAHQCCTLSFMVVCKFSSLLHLCFNSRCYPDMWPIRPPVLHLHQGIRLPVTCMSVHFLITRIYVPIAHL